MITTLILPRPGRRPRKPKVPQLYCAAALRACELAALRVKCAGNELAAHWVALTHEAAGGAAAVELLQALAWCQALETRFKERLVALDHARQQLDEVWRQAAEAQGQPWPLDVMLHQEPPTWSLLPKTNGLAATHSWPQRQHK